ncbi:MAG TPA: twin-arginine translocation signal domain-containing protein, partial [Verrucomicrobiae bacterium]|nr:twin-arginine translocation signal domain-containing protein [Verrucomicrobiae bacterium]
MSGPNPVAPTPRGAQLSAAYAGPLPANVLKPTTRHNARPSRRHFIQQLGTAAVWGALVSPAGLESAFAASHSGKRTLVGS